MEWVAAPWQDTELDALTQWSSRASPWAIWGHLHGMTSCGLQGATWNGRLLEELSDEQDRITGNATRHSSLPLPRNLLRTRRPCSQDRTWPVDVWWTDESINQTNTSCQDFPSRVQLLLAKGSATPYQDTGSSKPLAWQFSYVWCGMPWQAPIF